MDAQSLKRWLKLNTRLYRDGTCWWVPFMSQAQPLKTPPPFPRLRMLPTQPLVPLLALLLTVSGYYLRLKDLASHPMIQSV